MIDLKKIKERLAKVTPGPWDCDTTHSSVHRCSKDREHLLEGICDVTSVPMDTTPKKYRRGNATFIANAPADIAALIAEIERLQTLHLEQTRLADKYILERDSLKKEVAALRDCIHWLTANDHIIGVAKKRLIEADAIAKEREKRE